jgi:asparagine synthase (glutamine-hydrolysing)
MCGIFGFMFLHDKTHDESTVELSKSSLQLMKHRGPDHTGYHIDDHMFLGASRLAFMDRSPKGNMPLYNEDGSVAVVLNGEIYNHVALRNRLKRSHRFISQSDAETVAHLYEEMGESAFKLMEGMFAVAIWDRKQNKLVIARDRFGKKPLHYYQSSNSFLFGSELKSLIPHIPQKEISHDALRYFFNLNYIPAPHTIYKDIYKLEAGTYKTITLLSNTITHRYWSVTLTPHAPSKLSYSECRLQLAKTLQNSVSVRIPHEDVAFGVHLSGGIDSSLVTAIASQNTHKKVYTFTVNYVGNPSNESSFATLVAHKYRSAHHTINIDKHIILKTPDVVASFDEPFADPAIVPSWILNKSSADYVRVVLTGDGGDELFAGYQRYTHFLINRLPGVRFLSHILPLSMVTNEPAQSLLSSFRTTSNYEFHLSRITAPSIAYTQKDQLIWLQKRLKHYWAQARFSGVDLPIMFDIQTYLANDLLVKTDMLGMRFGQEARSPLLDDSLFSFTRSLPISYKITFGGSKKILKDVASTWLPRNLIQQKKEGFSFPLHWVYEKKNAQFIQSTLSQSSCLAEMINRKEHESLFNTNDLSKRRAWKIWQLFVLQLWLLQRPDMKFV